MKLIVKNGPDASFIESRGGERPSHTMTRVEVSRFKLEMRSVEIEPKSPRRRLNHRGVKKV